MTVARAGASGRNARRWDDPARLDQTLNREVYLAFWKVHILHHAAESPVYGHEIIRELRRHGYDISPGTVYPILRRMAANGWLRRSAAPSSAKARREHSITPKGRRVLEAIRRQLGELHDELG